MYSRPEESPREIIERLRVARGFRSRRALAIAAGMEQPTLHRYLSGTSTTMSVEHFMALARALGVTVSELLGEAPLASVSVREVQRTMAQMTEAQRAQLARLGRALLDADQ